jgi:hypothetical protein
MQFVSNSDRVKAVLVGAMLGCLCAIIRVPAPASATLSGQGVAGDNCTPFHGYRLGYRTASQARIVQQSIILQNGWKLVGWIIRDAHRDAFFVPYEPYFDPAIKDAAGTLPSLYATGRGRDPSRGYASYMRWRGANGLSSLAPPELPKPMLVTDCFARPLS